jgi:hypothetical protein
LCVIGPDQRCCCTVPDGTSRHRQRREHQASANGNGISREPIGSARPRVPQFHREQRIRLEAIASQIDIARNVIGIPRIFPTEAVPLHCLSRAPMGPAANRHPGQSRRPRHTRTRSGTADRSSAYLSGSQCGSVLLGIFCESSGIFRIGDRSRATRRAFSQRLVFWATGIRFANQCSTWLLVHSRPRPAGRGYAAGSLSDPGRGRLSS